MARPTVIGFAKINSTEAIRLHWSDGSSGNYCVRGALSWPRVMLRGGAQSLQGYAIAAALNVTTDTIVILDHGQWNVVERGLVFNPDLVPVVPFMADWWSRFALQRYFWHASGESWSQYRSQIRQCDYLIPQPRLIEVEWDDDGMAEQSLLVAGAEKRLKLPASLYERMKAADYDKDHESPARSAMLALVVGMQRRRFIVEHPALLDTLADNPMSRSASPAIGE